MRQKRAAPEHDTTDDEPLEDDALDGVSGGSGRIAHELTHTVQQSTGVGQDETISIGTNKTISVGSQE